MAPDLGYIDQRYLISFVVRKRKRRCFAASFFCAFGCYNIVPPAAYCCIVPLRSLLHCSIVSSFGFAQDFGLREAYTFHFTFFIFHLITTNRRNCGLWTVDCGLKKNQSPSSGSTSMSWINTFLAMFFPVSVAANPPKAVSL